jgi:hypothetical protein
VRVPQLEGAEHRPPARGGHAQRRRADAIILKGLAQRVTDRQELDRVDGYAEKYVDPYSGTVATIFVEDDHVYRVRPRLVMAWAYAAMTTRTEWELA